MFVGELHMADMLATMLATIFGAFMFVMLLTFAFLLIPVVHRFLCSLEFQRLPVTASMPRRNMLRNRKAHV
jgi:hypothetical protein